MDDLAGGWFYASFIEMLLEHFPVRGYLTEQGLVRLLVTHKIIAKHRPQELTEALWSVEDKERFRALSAAVTFGEDLTDLLLSQKEEAHGDHEADATRR